MTDPIAVIVATLILIVLSAFFVIIEFALLGARRYRLEEMAATSRSARAALRGMNDLTLMLAGAQLGITFCTFALGAVTKPAIDTWLGPVLLGFGLPGWAADTASFGLALFAVTFLHLVVGEMAPKSWAIAHPEKSALAIGLASRGYVWPLRPLLAWVNRLANRLVRASGVEPVESAAVGGRDVETIRQLVEHSGRVGTLQPQLQRQLSSLINLGELPVDTLIADDEKTAFVPSGATVADIQKAAIESGHLRILLLDETGLNPFVVHVRDTLLEPERRPARGLARRALVLDAGIPVYEALSHMRQQSVQLAVIRRDRRMIGVVTLADIIRHILPVTTVS